jgi:replication initiation protein RepC
LETYAKSSHSSANESQIERHIQDSNPESHIEFEPAPKETPPVPVAPDLQKPQAAHPTLSLTTVLLACPDIVDYAKGGIRNWRDLVITASIVCSALGVTPSAWEEARRAMGEQAAAIIIAALLQRGAAIASAGGYLRALTRKTQSNEFSLTPMLMALFRARTRQT